MDYPNKTVYILDDTRRPHIKALAEELGCKYITRPDNKHAKAGNLNNALKQTNGELISIMDADFVPFKNFLTRTVGFFQNSKIDLVQTPQYFYNPHYHARNLGLDRMLPNDLENFYGYIQPARDVGNSVKRLMLLAVSCWLLAVGCWLFSPSPPIPISPHSPSSRKFTDFPIAIAPSARDKLG